MAMRILDSARETTPPFFDYQLEQLLIATSFLKLNEATSKSLLQLLIDQRSYDLSLSRHINLRYSDLSSIFKSSKKQKYLQNLFIKNQESLLNEKAKTLLIVTHQLLDNTNYLKELSLKKFTRILCVRHPYYLYHHWVSYVEYFGKKWNDFTLTFGENGTPWFLDSSVDFANKSTPDKAVICISSLTNRQEEYLHKEKDLIAINFENFVLNPHTYIAKLGRVFQLEAKSLNRVLTKEHLPRIHINASRRRKVYQRYGADQLSSDLDHRSDYDLLKSTIQKSVSKGTFESIEESARLYENRFGRWYEL